MMIDCTERVCLVYVASKEVRNDLVSLAYLKCRRVRLIVKPRNCWLLILASPSIGRSRSTTTSLGLYTGMSHLMWSWTLLIDSTPIHAVS
jgi:hypothetical protein